MTARPPAIARRRLLQSGATLAGLAAASPLVPATAQWSDEGVAEMLGHYNNILYGPIDAGGSSLNTLVNRGNPDAAAALIQSLRFARGADGFSIAAALRELTGHDATADWFQWMVWQEANPEITPHPAFEHLKLDLFTRIDPEFRRFITVGQERSIRLEEVTWGGVRVDGIPPLTNPELVPADDAQTRYLTPEELVFGIEINGDVRAYPLRLLDWHEMFNDVIGGQPVSLAYCTLCGAGILFKTDAEIEGVDGPLIFSSTGMLYRSNKLMYDRNTDSVWNQFTGEPVWGELHNKGVTLDILPVVITDWQTWLRDNPDTKVLTLNTGFTRDYSIGAAYQHYFDSPDLMFPAVVADPRNQQKDYIFGVRAFGGAKAWPLTAFEGGRVINDQVGFTEVVLIGDAATRSVRAYQRDGQSFTAGADARQLTDQAGGTWQISEAKLEGPDGQELPRVGGHIAYWFAWAGYLGDSADLFTN